MPDQPGGDLHVEQVGRRPADRLEAELDLAPAGVDDRLGGPAAATRLPERGHVVDGHGVDHGQPAVGGDLHQAQHRPVGVLGDELGVEGDRAAPGKFRQNSCKLRVGGDVLVCTLTRF